MLRRAAALAAALAALASGGDAAAYCRSSVCVFEGGETGQGKVCDPPEEDDCGLVLAWRQPCIGFAVQRDASRQIDAAAAEEVLRQAFAAWMKVDCGNGAPSIEVMDLGTVDCAAIEYNQHGGNANVLIFRDDFWPHESAGVAGATDTIALTTVTYDIDKGDIFDADIEVNGVQNTFTTTDTTVDVDLLSVLTHEAGHFLGLAHSSAPEATMDPVYPGGTDLRTPAADDILGICTVYPADRSAAGECTGIPRHGFSPACLQDQTEGKCGVAAGRGSGDGVGWWGVATVLAIGAVGRRRRVRGRVRGPVRERL